MQPAFRHEHLRGYVSVMRQEITAAIASSHVGDRIDLVDERFTLTTTIAKAGNRGTSGESCPTRCGAAGLQLSYWRHAVDWLGGPRRCSVLLARSPLLRAAAPPEVQPCRPISSAERITWHRQATRMGDLMRPKQNRPEQIKTLESTLWEAADRLRSRVDSAEYKHVVLGLIFLKYVSDVFAKRRQAMRQLVDDPGSDYFMPTEDAKAAVLEDRDEYTSEGVFWIPEGHRWGDLRKAAKQTDIGERIDAAMDAIEKENPSLRGILPKRYARRELTPAMLGGLIDTFSRKDLAGEEHKGLDVLGRVYEYFLGKFATAEGKLGGEFYTPRSIVRLMVEMLEPFDGRVFDPACGSGGMFVQAEEFVEAHGGRRNDISVFGQEQNPTTWRLAKMNLALRGIEANLGPEWGDSFHHDMHPDLRADFILTNPPFNVSEWGGERLRDDPRWKLRRATGRQRQLCLDPAHAASPIADGHDGHRPGERVTVIAAIRRGGDPPQPRRGRPRRVHCCAA